jgi:hypothetical protein
LATVLANDAAIAPDSLATVVVTFRTTLARKETMKRTLSRLSRVVSVTEQTEGDAALPESALVRLATSRTNHRWSQRPAEADQPEARAREAYLG